MPRYIDSYERRVNVADASLGPAALGAVGFHVLIAWAFLFVLPGLWADQRSRNQEIVFVDLGGAQASTTPDVTPAKEAAASESGGLTGELKGTIKPSDDIKVEDSGDVVNLHKKPTEEKRELIRTDHTTGPVIPPPVDDKVKDPGAGIGTTTRQSEPTSKVDNLEAAIQAKLAGVADTVAKRGDGERTEGGGAVDGKQIDRLKAAYYEHLRDIVTNNWVAPPGALSSGLRATFVIKIEPGGEVSVSQLENSSGNLDFDLSIERAVRKSIFPPLPEVFEGQADTVGFVFDADRMRSSGLTAAAEEGESTVGSE